MFFTLFKDVGEGYREKHFNKTLTKKDIDRFSKHKNFYTFVKLIVTNSNLDKLQQSLLKQKIDSESYDVNFFLAMNALRYEKESVATEYLDKILKITQFPYYVSSALFWKYLITNDYNYLEKIVEKNDLNIYTLYAYHFLNREDNFEIVSEVEIPRKKSSYRFDDPLEWVRLKPELKDINESELFERFGDENTLPYLALSLQKKAGSRVQYFIRPYKDVFESFHLERSILLYALARQESIFIPASISISYALGMMQIMPFNVESIAKEKGEESDLDSMFIPKKNVEYASHLIDKLESEFKHPLFISYAYNGGGGFTRRMLQKEGMFKEGKYQPWISLETVHYDESRLYGKKVLANYLIYSKLMGKKVDMNELLAGVILEYPKIANQQNEQIEITE